MNKKTKISLIITIIYAIFTLICVLHHETWADEAQVWLLCKNLSLPALLNHLHNEGHPIFIYLLVMPFAKLTTNIIYMQLICWVFMVASIYLLFRYSPFHIITKIAITLSAGYIYFLPVIARDYSLFPFLMFMAAILYSKQKEYPILYCTILSLIACTHVIMFVFVVILLLMFIYDNLIESENKKQFIIPVLIVIFSLLYVIWQLYDTIGSNCCIEPIISRNDIINSIIFVFSSFFKNAYNYRIYTINNNQFFYPVIDIPLISIMILAFIGCFILIFKNSKKIFILTTLSIGFQLIIYFICYPYCIYPIKIFIALSIIISAFWIMLKTEQIAEKNKRIINIVLSVFFLITSYNGFNYWILDLKNDYSGAKKLAKYIIENVDNTNALFLIVEEHYMSPIKYYLSNTNNKIISAIRNKEYQYTVWDEDCYSFYSEEKWNDIAIEYSKNTQSDIYIILIVPMNLSNDRKTISDGHFEEIFVNEPVVKEDEVYHLYKYKKN